MRPFFFFSPWQLFLVGLFIITTSTTYSLQGWNIDTQQISDMAPGSPSEPLLLLLENGIPDSPADGLALATADGTSSEFTQSDIINPDGILVQGGGGRGCPSDTRSSHPPRVRIRARDDDEKMCPKTFLRRPPNGEGEQQERTLLHLSPNGRGGGQKNSGGNGNGGDPSKPPDVIIPPEDSKLPYLFIPEVNRPKENPEICPEPMYPVPVCGRPSDTYPSSYTYPNQLTVDPCYPYVVLVGCISVEGGRIGYCCSSVEVAYGYDGLRDGEIDAWEEVLAGEGEMLWEIQKALMSGLSNPFKLVGFACIPMGTTSGEGEASTPF